MRALYRPLQYFNQHAQGYKNKIKAAVKLQASVTDEAIDYFLWIKDKAGILLYFHFISLLLLRFSHETKLFWGIWLTKKNNPE